MNVKGWISLVLCSYHIHNTFVEILDTSRLSYIIGQK